MNSKEKKRKGVCCHCKAQVVELKEKQAESSAVIERLQAELTESKETIEFLQQELTNLTQELILFRAKASNFKDHKTLTSGIDQMTRILQGKPEPPKPANSFLDEITTLQKHIIAQKESHLASIEAEQYDTPKKYPERRQVLSQGSADRSSIESHIVISKTPNQVFKSTGPRRKKQGSSQYIPSYLRTSRSKPRLYL